MPRVRTVLLAMLVSLLWGSSFVLTKIALTELGPLNIALLRWTITAVVFGVVLPCQGQLSATRAALRSDLPRFALLGLVGISAFYGFQNLALRFTTALNVGLLINLCTIFITILGVACLGERLPLSAAAGVLVSFVGATLVSLSQGSSGLEGGHLLGDALTVLAAICGAVYTVYGKVIVSRHPPPVVTALAAVTGAVILLPWAAWEGLALPRSLAVWAAILTLGAGSGALANLWWWHILRRMDAARAGVYLLVVPVVSSALAVVVLGETLARESSMGALLVLLGLYLTQRPSSAEHTR
jgi:drug/metabolite transporter (DMT)-like permease